MHDSLLDISIHHAITPQQTVQQRKRTVQEEDSSTLQDEDSSDSSSDASLISSRSTSPHLTIGMEDIPTLHTPVLDVDTSQLAKFLLKIPNSTKFLKGNFVSRFRTIFVEYLQKLVREPTNSLLWKKYLLLPCVVFTTTNRDALVARAALLNDDRWNSLTVYDLRNIHLLRPTSIRAAPYDKVQKHLQAGQFSRAMKALIATGSQSTSAPEGTAQSASVVVRELLQALHPPSVCVLEGYIHHSSRDSCPRGASSGCCSFSNHSRRS